MEKLSPQDKKLLRILQENSKFDITDLTQRLNMSRTSVYERIKRLESEGYIKKYAAIIDEKKVGLNFTVIVNVQLESQQFEVTEEFARQVRELGEVMQAYVISGVYDIVLKVVVKDPEEFNNFVVKKLSVIPQISKIQSSFVMSYIKQSTELPF
ncbi:Lrp/AsnC family transcriptional regulator [Salinimicrobium oceani]|uniref:Lrp/AsnC family transcriptional regulator n=1 Tax=Salinimicrobium oceani TaxID=2722702 RepID=A0ABX1CU29_9FLAO|nr:Lrp/AsnC family transcriptional regulator [Salinimicrobium oceani]NJW51799.1 Lrp/AsnC family transcriptional regulator [Salinimicrobium oceani]